MTWKDSCMEVLGYIPKSKSECLEEVIEEFVQPNKATCGVLFATQGFGYELPRRFYISGKEMPPRVVIDSNVFGRIIKRDYCNEFEYWKNCVEVLKRVEDGKIEGNICSQTIRHIDDILSKSNLESEKTDVKGLIKKTILAIPNLGIRPEPKIQNVKQRYASVIGEYRLSPEDIEDLVLTYVAEKEGASMLTYDTLLLSRIPQLPNAFTPEELLGFKLPVERCLEFCDHARYTNKEGIKPPLAISH